MNTALLVLRVVPGLLLIGHGLQKLVPPRYSPPLLHAMGHRATASGFEQLGIRPGLPAAVLAGCAEILGGFSLGAGSYSFNHWLDVSNWAGIHGWDMSHVARAGIALAIGVGAGLLTVIASWVAKAAPARTSVPATG